MSQLRNRFGPPVPYTRLGLQDRDYLLFELLNRHGPLPTNYLYELTRHVFSAEVKLRDRLAKLRNGFLTPAGEHVTYLSLPTWQGKNNYRRLIYDLTTFGVTALERKGIKAIKRRPEHGIHRFMGATVSASISVYVSQALRKVFVDQDKILGHPKTPAARLTEDYPFSIPLGKTRIDPDDFFAVQDPLTNKAASFYAVEYDRSKETIADDKARNSVGGKMVKYEEAILGDAFEKHLGIPNRNVKVLIITNNKRHKLNMQRWCKEHIKQHNRFFFSSVEGFHTDYWEIPELMLVRFENADGEKVEL